MKREEERKTLESILCRFLLWPVIFASTCLCSIAASGWQNNHQIPQETLPLTFSRPAGPVETVDRLLIENVNLTAVHLEDRNREQSGGPYRFALRQSVGTDTETSGTWEQIDSQTLLWRLHIISPGAKSLSLGFTEYNMPPGGRLFIYSADDKQVLGPYTENDNAGHCQLWTPLIFSDDIVSELIIPAGEVKNLKLTLEYINYGYRSTFLPMVTINEVGDSAECQINVACPQGDNWRDQIRSVALYHITRQDGSFWCTGTLINNTAEDDKPYFLTAFHCLDEYADEVLYDPQGVAASMVFYWNFQAVTCSQTGGGESQIQTGAYFRAAYSPSDFALVELDEMPPQEYNVYYAGWNRNNTAPAGGAAIHHPKADLKKIGTENHPLSITSWGDSVSPGDGTHLRLWHWEDGMTEPGSSGCPIFGPDKLLAGQLHGGIITSCDEERGPNWFGFLHRSWSGGDTCTTRLSDWLDPLATGQTTLEGKDPNWCTITGDFDCNKKVDSTDFAILANQWQNPPGFPSADIAPQVPDGIVDLLDLKVFALHWLETALP